jgi:hypothetical protein
MLLKALFPPKNEYHPKIGQAWDIEQRKPILTMTIAARLPKTGHNPPYR